MPKPNRRAPRLVGIFLIGCLLFNYPLLPVFNVRATILGVPVLYAYLFLAWGAVIALVAAVMRRNG